MKNKSPAFAASILLIGLFLCSSSVLFGKSQFPRSIATDHFKLVLEDEGISSLKYAQDRFDTDFILKESILGDVVIHYRFADGKWKQARTDRLADFRKVKNSKGGEGPIYEAIYEIKAENEPTLLLTVRFLLKNQSLVWDFCLQNQNVRPIEVGDIALPLRFNSDYGENAIEIMEKRVIKHHFISGYGSFIYWMRPNGEGPFLVMTPDQNTKLEYFEFTDQVRDVSKEFYVYIYSAVKGGLERRGTWRQPHTNLMLQPKGKEGDEKKHGFGFRWAKDFEGVRDVLYQEGLFDVRVVPGMTVPENLTALLSIRSRNPIAKVTAEFPARTKVEYLGEKQKDIHLYRVSFSRLGENFLFVRDDKNRHMFLEFFVTQPLETLIKKRSAFIVGHQQHRNPDKWYNGLFSQWDMRYKILRSPDDTDGFDGWWGYVLACDDPGLCKAPFLAAKNIHYPDPVEIRAIEYYLDNFVWGKLQRTDKETAYPYGIYGVPNWYENRTSEWGFDSNGKGLEHIWRIYDYPHIIMLYFHMYQIAKQYPQYVCYLDKNGYLERAVGTTKAYFGYPYELLPWYEIYKWGCYNELLIVDLIQALIEEGRVKDAEWLRQEWEKKVKYFIYDDPYPFRSEYSFDTTAFESSYAFGKYARENPMKPDQNLWYDKNKKKWHSHPVIKREDAEQYLQRQMKANLACRGVIEPTFYYLGSDIRGESGRYALSYMSQMGGWALQDYALSYAKEPFDLIKLGYASYLSSWALMNTGTEETNYGYWYPGKENDGASGWAFEAKKYGPIWIRKEMGRGVWFYDGEIDLGYGGALRAAATIITEDPFFGWIALGGILEKSGDEFRVTPRDGLRQRFFLINQAGKRIQVILDFDGFAREKPIVIKANGKEISFVLENRSSDSHSTWLRLKGFEPGDYVVLIDDSPFSKATMKKDKETVVRLQVTASQHKILIKK